MRSFRLGPELVSRLKQAAAARGESLPEFIRRAAAERADATLSGDHGPDFDDILGVVHGGGGQARRTGKVFTETVVARDTHT